MAPAEAVHSVIEREDEGFVARFSGGGRPSQGDTIEEARQNRGESVELVLEAGNPPEIEDRLHSEIYVTRVADASCSMGRAKPGGYPNTGAFVVDAMRQLVYADRSCSNRRRFTAIRSGRSGGLSKAAGSLTLRLAEKRALR